MIITRMRTPAASLAITIKAWLSLINSCFLFQRIDDADEILPQSTLFFLRQTTKHLIEIRLLAPLIGYFSSSRSKLDVDYSTVAL